MPPSAPAQYEGRSPQRHRSVFGDEVKAEDVQRKRQNEEEQDGQRHEAISSDRLKKRELMIMTVPSRSYLRTLSANSPCGRIIRIATIAKSVSTLAIDPDMKNSMVDCASEMVKADAMVPIRLAAPPNTTTRKVSTM